ncbi:hypothetical protein HBH49_229430 [Parastagonospora nodorum]|nr:hypothetical protein HBH49_229430 [Parastagonospora nodorum]
MDNLLQGNAPPGVGDATASIPGYGMIAQVMLGAFGVDVGQIVSIYLLLFGFYQGGLMLWHKACDYFLNNATSTVRIDDNDILYSQFMSWVSTQQVTANSRDLKASSSVHVTSYDDSDDEDDDDLLNEEGLFDYEKWSSVKPVHYEPNFGVDRLYHNGHWIQFEKGEKENKYNHRWESHVEIRCIGRSTQPIKDLLSDIKELSRRKKTNNTWIYRPDTRSEGYWTCQAVRPSRPMSTVSLDMEQKKQIVQDVNEYLHPVTAQWYAARGIPHRRGYLFHGQPGTGKTSLSFALAGIFGLGIYCASLSDDDISESRLSALFDALPTRCLVLLEDIDSAGVRRDESSDDTDSDDESDSESEKSERNSKSLLGRLTQRTRASEAVEKKNEKKGNIKEKGKKGKGNISLAGLLNVIDGAASAEGRVLIMTTNYPEKLDSALIRPGRVDLQTKFTLATHEQIRAIFTRMYSTDNDVKKKQKKEGDGEHACKDCTHCSTKHGTSSSIAVELAPEKLAELAEKFAQELPDVTLSPAEIQGYLLKKKTDPDGAVAGAKEWKDKVLEAKKKGKKVVD